MKRVGVLCAIIIAIVFFACEKQESEITTVNLSFWGTGQSNVSEKTLRSSNLEGIYIDTAIIILEKIDLKLKDNPDSDYDPDTYILRGPYIIDLLNRSSNPVVLPTEVKPGIYSMLQAMLFIPAGYGFSMYISGTYTNTNNWRRFIYEKKETGMFVIESQTGFEIYENRANDIWVMIDVVALFNGVDFNKAEVDGTNIIRINGSANADLSSIIGANFAFASVIDDAKDINGEGDGISGSDNEDNEGSNDDSGEEDFNQGNNKDKEKDKFKEKEKEKEKNKDKHKNKDKNKNKDKDKDKDKNKDND